MADYMVVASGASSRQVAAMAEHLEFKLKQEKVDILGLEGLRQADWVLLDANDVIVHIFRPEVREFYGLERMWVDDMSVVIYQFSGLLWLQLSSFQTHFSAIMANGCISRVRRAQARASMSCLSPAMKNIDRKKQIRCLPRY